MSLEDEVEEVVRNSRKALQDKSQVRDMPSDERCAP